MHDIVIIGGGPTGLSAALYALRAGKSVLILENNSMGGQIATSPRVENYPGIPVVSGLELTDSLLSQVMSSGGKVDLAETTGITDGTDKKTVHTTSGDYDAKSVIIATGAKHRKLGIDREEALTGKGVSYCAVCDGAFFTGRPVAVSGGGNAALQDAILLANTSPTVYLIHRRNTFRAEAVTVERIRKIPNITLITDSKITALMGNDALEGIVVENLVDGTTRELQVNGLFVAVGFEPKNDIFSNVARLDDKGWFASGEDCRTFTPGIFVAGDCRAKGVRQLVTAVGDGATAAVSACQYIDCLPN